MKMKNINDLVFNPHPIAKEAEKLPSDMRQMYAESKQAKMDFENGYGISVLFGSMFYSNGIDTYEVGILKDGVLFIKNIRFHSFLQCSLRCALNLRKLRRMTIQ